jgi:hypothetical protein
LIDHGRPIKPLPDSQQLFDVQQLLRHAALPFFCFLIASSRSRSAPNIRRA